MRSSTPLSDEVLQAAEQELADPTRERTLNNITSAENVSFFYQTLLIRSSF